MSSSALTVNAILRAAVAQLEAAGISTARLDSLVLLEDVLNINRTQLLAHPDLKITEVDAKKYTESIKKRTLHIPLAYIRHKSEFYGREFYIDERVLEPRPESETMIEILKDIPLRRPVHIADIGTGSGALGITAALEIPGSTITLLDVDSDALTVAQKNTQLHTVRTQKIQNDLLEGLPEHYDILLCNLPYVPDEFHINRAASHEPTIAIFGGEDGLDLYRTLFAQISARTDKPAHILTESLPLQHEALSNIAADHGYTLTRTDDFIQYFTFTRD